MGDIFSKLSLATAEAVYHHPPSTFYQIDPG